MARKRRRRRRILKWRRKIDAVAKTYTGTIVACKVVFCTVKFSLKIDIIRKLVVCQLFGMNFYFYFLFFLY